MTTFEPPTRGSFGAWLEFSYPLVADAIEMSLSWPQHVKTLTIIAVFVCYEVLSSALCRTYLTLCVND